LAAEPDLRRRLVEAGHATAAELTLPRWLALLEQWHGAAAAGFRDGPPSDREPLASVLSRSLRTA
jgi:hypothetical protein